MVKNTTAEIPKLDLFELSKIRLFRPDRGEREPREYSIEKAKQQIMDRQLSTERQ
jgi:hypothetical protein